MMELLSDDNLLYYSLRHRSSKAWRLIWLGFLLTALLFLGQGMIRTTLPVPSSQDSISNPRNKQVHLRNCPGLLKPPQHSQLPISNSSVEVFKEQTRTEVLEELCSTWLHPPSTLPSNADPRMSRSDVQGVWQLQRTVLQIFRGKKNGFFIESGANDGVWLSNTLQLEQQYNWTGLLVEADPKVYKLLEAAHRRAWIINACLGLHSLPTKMRMIRLKSVPGFASLKAISPNMKRHPGAQEFATQCFPLTSILAAIGKLEVDYLSLDIEGAELGVLSTVPWDFVYIKVISLESNRELVAPIRKLLEAQGYLLGGFVDGELIHDYVFIHREFEKEMAFEAGYVQGVLNQPIRKD